MDVDRDLIIREGKVQLERAREQTGLANVEFFPRPGRITFFHGDTVLEVHPGMALGLWVEGGFRLAFMTLGGEVIKLAWSDKDHCWAQQRSSGQESNKWTCFLELD